MQDALPTYSESFARPILLEQTPSHNTQSDTSSNHSLDPPPAFSLSPITLTFSPNSTLIKPLYQEAASTRALYELTSPLTGRHRSVYLAEVPVITTLDKSGHLPKIEKRHHLYKIFETQEGGQRHTAIDGRKTRTIQGTILRRSAQGTAFVATNHGDIWGSRGRLIYCARANGDIIEWLDCKGRVVAIDHAANERDMPETLQILVPLDRKMLDMLVAVWVGRIHQDVRREVEEERRRSDASQYEHATTRPKSFLSGGRSFLKTLKV